MRIEFTEWDLKLLAIYAMGLAVTWIVLVFVQWARNPAGRSWPLVAGAVAWPVTLALGLAALLILGGVKALQEVFGDGEGDR